MESNLKKRGRPRRLDGRRCTDCLSTETVCDGPRNAKGPTNGAQLWRCRNCGRQFIEGKVRRSKRLISANEAFARSVFVMVPPKQCRQRSDFFRYLEDLFYVGGNSGVSYRTIYRWYVKWEAERAEEVRAYPEKLSKAPQAVKERVFYDDLSVAMSRLDSETHAEYFRVLLESLKEQSSGTVDIKQAIHITLMKLQASTSGKERQAFLRIIDTFKKASKYSKYVYTQSDPMPHIRAFLPSELQDKNPTKSRKRRPEVIS